MNAIRQPSPIESEPSPEEQIRIFSESLLTLLEEADPERGYTKHAQQTANLASSMTGSDHLLFPGYIHDLYDASARDSSSELGTEIRTQFANALGGETPIDPDTALYGLAIESCSYGVRKTANHWRDELGKNLRKLIANDGVVDTDHTIGAEIRDTYKVSTADSTVRVAKELEQATGYSYADITPDLRKFRVGLNLESVLDALEKYDIDSFYRLTAELVDNLRNPPLDKPASTWRDAQAVLSFFAPALEVTGDTANANWARDEALRAIYHSDQQLMNRAHTYLKEAENFEASPRNNAITNAISGQLSLGEQVEFELNTRVKSAGSIAEKLSLRAGSLYRLKPNDMVGYRVIIDDTTQPVSEDEWRQIAERLFSSLSKNAQLGLKAISNSEFYLDTNTKPSGYKSVHGNFMVEADSDFVTIEVQVVTRSAHEFNSLQASPVLQKARHGFTKLSEVLRRRDRAVEAKLKRRGTTQSESEAEKAYTAEDKSVLSHLIERMKDIRDRAHDIRKGLIKPRSLARIASIPDFANSHPILETLSEMDVMHEKVKGLEFTLPTTFVDVERFVSVTEKLMPEVLRDPRFIEAFEIARELHQRHNRKHTNKGTYFENHILPMTLGLMYKISKDVRYRDRINQVPLLCAALLHDFKEDAAKHLKDRPDILDNLNHRYMQLVDTEDMAIVDDMVEAVTKPTDAEVVDILRAKDDRNPIIIGERHINSPLLKPEVARIAVKKLVNSNLPDAMLIKFYDRSQNIRCDIARLDVYIDALKTGQSIDEIDLNDIYDYRIKSQLFFDKIDLEYIRPELAWIIQEIDNKLKMIEVLQEARETYNSQNSSDE